MKAEGSNLTTRTVATREGAPRKIPPPPPPPSFCCAFGRLVASARDGQPRALTHGTKKNPSGSGFASLLPVTGV